MSAVLNEVLSYAIIGVAGIGAFYYIRCGQKLGTYAPLPVLECMFEGAAKTILDPLKHEIETGACNTLGGSFCKDDASARQSSSCVYLNSGCQAGEISAAECALQLATPLGYSNSVCYTDDYWRCFLFGEKCPKRIKPQDTKYYKNLFEQTYTDNDQMSYARFRLTCNQFGRATGKSEWSTDGVKDKCSIKDKWAHNGWYNVERNIVDGRIHKI